MSKEFFKNRFALLLLSERTVQQTRGVNTFQSFLKKKSANPACPVFLLDEQVLYFRNVPSLFQQGDTARNPAVVKHDVIAILEYSK